MSVDQFLLSSDTTDLNYPEIRPTLDLNFARVKALDPRITFTRSSGGSYVGADGLIKYAGVNEARFDHNPVTGESLGLLIEEARTNLLLRSEEFDNAGVWGALSATVSSNTQVAPNGTTSAETITDINGATTANVGCFQSTTLADSTNYAMSCYVKAGTKTTCRVGIRDKAGANIFANFNLATGTTTTGNAISSTIQNAGNGWYRCTAICTSATGATSPRGIVFMDIGSYTADGTGTIHVWGAQLEAGAFPTSYIPTQASSRTRAADNASITGTNFSSWYNQNEGTIYTNNRIPYTPNPNVSLYFLIFGINSGNRHSIEQTTVNGLTYITQNSGLIQYWTTSGSGVLPANTNRKTTYAYASSNNTTILSGTSNQTYNFGQRSSVDVYKSMTTLYIGRFSNSLFFLNGTIARFTYYPKTLPPSQLQALTR